MKIKSQDIRKRPNNSEVFRLLASSKKAKKILNWSPDFKGKAGLARGLTKTVDWYKDKRNLRHFKSLNFAY